jgi:hypothetical protein
MHKTGEIPVFTSTSRLRSCLCLVAAAAAIALLSYDAVLLGRVINDKTRHISGDIVVLAYIVAAFCFISAALLVAPIRGAGFRRPRWLIAGLCLCAATGWFALHGGGFIYSHESMVREPCCSLFGQR